MPRMQRPHRRNQRESIKLAPLGATFGNCFSYDHWPAQCTMSNRFLAGERLQL
jgi:hypothetical protein